MTFAVEELKSSDIINFLTGCTEFEVESPEPEKLLTSCMEKNVDIWAIRRIDACTLRFRCRLPDEKEVRQICDVCGATSVGEVSTGLPVRAKGRMRRWGFLAGVILFFALIILMSNVIWRVDTVGYKDKTQLTEVECFLRERGLTVGALRGMLDEQTLRRDLMRNFEDIAGATVNFFGSVAVVELEPAVPKPEIEITEPANLIAEEDAQIIEITVFNGVPAVKKNDIVRKGQLLVGGVYDSKRIGYRPVHARALIKARVNRAGRDPRNGKRKNRVYADAFRGVVRSERLRLRKFSQDLVVERSSDLGAYNSPRSADENKVFPNGNGSSLADGRTGLRKGDRAS